MKHSELLIKEISLTSIDGGRHIDSIIAQVLEFSIFQNLFCPVMTIEMQIFDAIDIISSFPIVGDELINLELEGPDQKLKSFEFRITKVLDRHSKGVEGQGVYYTLYGASKEIQENIHSVNHIFKDTSADLVCKKILSKMGSKKRFFCNEKSLKTFDLDTINLPPFVAIDKARLLQTSAINKSSAFVFYEKSDGFHLDCIESLLTARKPLKEFTFDSGVNIDTDQNRDFRNVINFHSLKDSSSALAELQGVLNSKMKTFDIVTGEVRDKEVNQDLKLKTIDNELSHFSKKIKYPIQVFTNIIDSFQSDSNVQDFFLERKLFLTKLHQQIFNLQVPGDLDIEVSDLIQIDAPVNISLTSDSRLEEDKRFDGKFLVSRVRHQVIMNPRLQYFSHIEVLKGSISF
jgi:hypothetical protein